MIYNPIINEHKKRAEKYFLALLKGEHKFRIEKIYPKRSVKQNNYLHVIISLYAIEFGYSLKEAKQYLKDELGYMFYNHDTDDKFYFSTAEMDSKQLTTFIDKIRDYSSQNGYYLPSADEYKYNWFNYENEINKYKQYL